ncbi:MAG: D-alanine--D-alanine ligase [Actinobacteria bacterium]|nr:D-alanine--D-alanine ligase [Actinomycetota bacterium]
MTSTPFEQVPVVATEFFTPDTTELPERATVVVLYGGASAEHDVSRVSAANVYAALNPHRYDLVTIAIDRDGVWRTPSRTVPRHGDEGLGGFAIEGEPVEAMTAIAEVIASSGDTPVVVVPVVHGPNCEDGTLQGMLELLAVPYVGTGVLGSSVSMDKAMAKTVLAASGIAQGRFRSAYRWDLSDALIDEMSDDLGYPLFVKPANMGSSVGVSRATDRAGFVAALHEALRHDELVVVEETIVGREVEIAVLGNEAPMVSLPGEILAGAEFYDFDDKYRDGVSKTVTPADLSDAQIGEMRAIALATYRALRAEGLARVDMFLEEDGRGFLVNEINTLPGFTSISMYPMMWQASGIGYGELLDEMIRLAFARHARRRFTS